MSTDADLTLLLRDVRNCLRAALHPNLKSVLTTALPDEQTRRAYRMLDGNATSEQAKTACKMSPNNLLTLTQRWISMGLMKPTAEKKIRLFELQDYGLLEMAED